MAKIGFITTGTMPVMPRGDLLTIEELSGMGHQVSGVRWDAGDSVDNCDLLVFRSCWNYHLKQPEFFRWLTTLPPTVINPLATIRWNIDKRYLLEIAKSARIVPTELLEQPSPDQVREAARQRGWDQAVIKPTIGATAFQSMRLLTDDDFDNLTESDLPGPMLLQPYLTSIESAGEYSLVFLDGEYSHAVLKRAIPGDYRVQEEFGGSVETVDPSADLLKAAQRAISALTEKPVYARVDLVLDAEGPMVMEIELIEPELYLDRAPGSARTFAEAICSRLSG